jgi:aspartate/methionine/tyrosine aminotransferase
MAQADHIDGMHLPPFLLDQWLNAYLFAPTPIRHNLASSTGPGWSLGEMLALADKEAREAFQAIPIKYAPPNGARALRERIGALHGVDPDWVVVTTGASEALSVLFCIAAEKGAAIVAPTLVFPPIPVMARAWGLETVFYELSRGDRFAHSADAVLAAADHRTRLAIVNTPNNPTGAVMAEAELASLAEALGGRDATLVVDEVYHPLYFEGARAASAAASPNTIVIGDMSKALSLSGLRIGWLIDRDASRRERLIDARSYFTISGSPVTEAIAAMALDAQDAILARLQATATENLGALDAFVAAHRGLIDWVRPSGGTTAFPWFADGRDARPFCEALARAGVLVAPGDCFGAAEHFRVGFAAETASDFADALAIAANVLRDA